MARKQNSNKKDLHDPDNQDDVITHLEPDILECEVKWALGSIIMNKASGCDRIPGELFQILKDDAVKVLHSACQQIWKPHLETRADSLEKTLMQGKIEGRRRGMTEDEMVGWHHGLNGHEFE